MPRKVLVTPHLLKPGGPHEQPLASAGFEIVYPPEDVDTLQPQVIDGLLRSDADLVAMIASTEPLSRDILRASHLKVVARLGVGFDSIDIPAATELGIPIAITPGTLEDSVAEQTLAMLLAVTRAIIQRDREVRSGTWLRHPMPRLNGKTFGLVGMGRIGRAVIPRVQGLGMRVLVLDPAVSPEAVGPFGVEIARNLDELLREADVISLHVPCTPATENMINRHTLTQLKPNAVLINTSRGGLIDEPALVDALQNGRLLGAALDVFRAEPLPLDSPLLNCENLVLSTHVAGIDQDTTKLAGRMAAENIIALANGQWPTGCIVNEQLRTAWNWQAVRHAT